MANVKSKRHTHKYHKKIVAGTKVWACALGDCLHYMPKHMESLVEGKNSYCWDCDKEFRLDVLAIAMDNPICIECRLDESGNKLVKTDEDSLDEFVRNLRNSKSING